MAESCFTPTFTAEQINAAAGQLQQRRALGQSGDLLAEPLRPLLLADALAVQLKVAQQYSKVIGWKCGMPSQDANGQPKIVLGPLYQVELQQGTRCAQWPSAQGLARVEPEYAYPLLADVAPGADNLSDHDVFALLGKPHLALELIQSRYQTDAGAQYPDQLADGLFNQGLWLGPTLIGPEQSHFDLTLTPVGQPSVTHAARHPNDNPRAPLPWLVNFLRAQGVPLTAGQVIITGSFAGVLELPFGSDIRWQFGEEPAFQLSFCPR
ncbi:MAG: hydratase [Rheinheimera sp.]|nr:MAG: hydratase [Rheinheimera sp.]